MYRRIVPSTTGHELNLRHVQTLADTFCEACSTGKLQIIKGKSKLMLENPVKLSRLQGDVCGPITPACRPFRYFLVLLDASGAVFFVCLLATKNLVFVRIKTRTSN